MIYRFHSIYIGSKIQFEGRFNKIYPSQNDILVQKYDSVVPKSHSVAPKYDFIASQNDILVPKYGSVAPKSHSVAPKNGSKGTLNRSKGTNYDFGGAINRPNSLIINTIFYKQFKIKNA